MSAAENSRPSVIDESGVHGLATDEEFRDLFEREVRRTLGIDAEEFLRRLASGEIANDDRDPGVTALFMMLPYLPADMRPA